MYMSSRISTVRLLAPRLAGGISYHLRSGPAMNETCATVSRPPGGEVGQFMVRMSPRISWIRDTLSTPYCARGRLARERVV
jgi:hypothetical protein